MTELLFEVYEDIQKLSSFLYKRDLKISEEDKKERNVLFSKVLVCKRKNASVIGISVENKRNFGVCTCDFDTILDAIANNARQNTKIFSRTEFENPSWRRVYNIVGSDFFFHLCTGYELFLKSLNNLVQLTGKPFTVNNNKNTKRTRTRKRKIVQEDRPPPVTKNVCSEQPETNVKRKRTKRKRRKNTKLASAELSELTAPHSLLSFELQPPSFLFSNNLRERLFSVNLNGTNDQVLKLILGQCYSAFMAEPDHKATRLLSASVEDLENRKSKIHLPGLLRAYLPLPTDFKQFPMEKLVQMWIKSQFVQKFLEKLLGKLLPPALFGVTNTSKAVKYLAAHIVSVRKRESLTVKEFRAILKLKDVPWIHCIPQPNVQKYLFYSLIVWLMKVVADLVRSCFYVTDSQHLRNRLLFYRKSLWMYVVHLGNRQLKTVAKLKELHTSTKSQPLGVRFLPKHTSVRPIVISRNGTNRVAKLNWKLQPVKSVLSVLAKEDPTLLGSAAKDWRCIQRKWAKLVEESGNLANNKYMVKADLDACFDCIDQKQLMHILREIIPANSEFQVQQYRCFCSRRHGYCRKKRRTVSNSPRCSSFIPALETRSHMVSVPVDTPEFWSSDSIGDWLNCLVTGHVISLGGKIWQQTGGIAQGFAISVILCNMYLGHMEKFQWPQLVAPNSPANTLLMRHTDDFILATDDRDIAEAFLLSIITGTEKFGGHARDSKTVLNFNIDATESEISDQVPWCGVAFDPRTLEVGPDIARWKCMEARDLFNQRRYKKRLFPWLLDTLVRSVSLRAPPLCFDPNINSPAKLAANRNHMRSVARRVAYAAAQHLKLDRSKMEPILAEAWKAVNKAMKNSL